MKDIIRNQEIVLIEDVNQDEEVLNEKIGVSSIEELVPRTLGEEEKHYNINTRCPIPPNGTPYCYHLSLHKHMDRWAIYRMGVPPVAGNQFAYIKPKQFGGLSYRAHLGSWNDVLEIQTQDYGLVQIYAPKDEDSCQGKYVIHQDYDLSKGPEGERWGSKFCRFNYSKH